MCSCVKLDASAAVRLINKHNNTCLSCLFNLRKHEERLAWLTVLLNLILHVFFGTAEDRFAVFVLCCYDSSLDLTRKSSTNLTMCISDPSREALQLAACVLCFTCDSRRLREATVSTANPLAFSGS